MAQPCQGSPLLLCMACPHYLVMSAFVVHICSKRVVSIRFPNVRVMQHAPVHIKLFVKCFHWSRFPLCSCRFTSVKYSVRTFVMSRPSLRLHWDLTPSSVNEMAASLIEQSRAVYDRVGKLSPGEITFENSIKVWGDRIWRVSQTSSIQWRYSNCWHHVFCLWTQTPCRKCLYTCYLEILYEWRKCAVKILEL